MKKPIPIHKLSAQTGLTSRTLRYWESEELFTSMRDFDSDRRVYDEEAVRRIRITAFLREMDLPIKKIRTVLEKKTFDCLRGVVMEHVAFLRAGNEINSGKEKRLIHFLSILEKHRCVELPDTQFLQLLTGMETVVSNANQTEELIMYETKNQNDTLQFVTLPEMRTAYNVAVGVSPEDEAMEPVIAWLESAELTGTARIFGGNMPPMPSGEGKPYGFAVCASIPESVTIPVHLKEMRLPGGVYAMLPGTDDIGASWNRLMKMLSGDSQYTSDRSRLCLEEHIKNDRGGYLLFLYEPVKARAKLS